MLVALVSAERFIINYRTLSLFIVKDQYFEGDTYLILDLYETPKEIKGFAWVSS